MRTRKSLAVFGTGLVLAGCVMLYLMIDLMLFPNDHGTKLPLKDVSFFFLVVRFVDKVFQMLDVSCLIFSIFL